VLDRTLEKYKNLYGYNSGQRQVIMDEITYLKERIDMLGYHPQKQLTARGATPRFDQPSRMYDMST